MAIAAWTIGLVFFLAVAALSAVLAKRRGAAPPTANAESQPLSAVPKCLVTERERPFWTLLTDLCTRLDLVVMTQVHFGGFLDAGTKYGVQNTLNKRADFLICDVAMKPLAVIELDDSSHWNKKAKDRERDRLVSSAGIAVLRYDSVPERLAMARALMALRINRTNSP